jgi:hypothetical protein
MRLFIAALFLICQGGGQTVFMESARIDQVSIYVRKNGPVVMAYSQADAGSRFFRRLQGLRGLTPSHPRQMQILQRLAGNMSEKLRLLGKRVDL